MNRGEFIRRQTAKAVKEYLSSNEAAGWKKGLTPMDFVNTKFKQAPYWRVLKRKMDSDLNVMVAQKLAIKDEKAGPYGFGDVYYPRTPEMVMQIRRHVGGMLEDAPKSRRLIDSIFK